MIKSKLKILFLIVIQSCFSQNLIQIISNHDNYIIDNTKEYKLVIISDSDCEYCIKTYKKIKDLTSKIQIIIIDSKESNSYEVTKYGDYNFIYAKNVPEIKTHDFFPTLYLYDKDNKLIWNRKGWFDRNLKKIKMKINYH